MNLIQILVIGIISLGLFLIPIGAILITYDMTNEKKLSFWRWCIETLRGN